MTAAVPRRVALGAVLAAAASAALPGPAPVAAAGLRGGGAPLPDHADLWAKVPLPFTPAEAWRLLSPETQAEIGAAVIGMHLAQYVHGDSVDEADAFIDDDLRDAACDAGQDILNRMEGRLHALLPDLYGPDGDHPRWALNACMAHPLGAVLLEPPDRLAPTDDADPIHAAISTAEAARRAHQGIFDDGLDEDDDAQMARLDELREADCAAFRALAEIIPTTNAGDVALADFYLCTLDDPDGMATAHLQHLRDVLAGGVS